MDYIKACKTITMAGGWVFRMGDPSMTKLPKMNGVIDLVLDEAKELWYNGLRNKLK